MQNYPFNTSPPSYQPPQDPAVPPVYPPMQKPPRKKRLWLVLAIIAAIVILGAISGTLSDSSKSNTPDTQATAQPTSVPTSAPTSAPTQKPTPLTTEQRVMSILKAQDADVKNSVYDGHNVSAEKQIGAQLDDNGVRDAIKMDCFNIQKALWTASPSLKLGDVTVFLYGDVTDAYGNTSNGQVGFCTLKSGTASKFNWQNLTWNTAWSVYDNTGMLPSLQQ